MLRARFAAASVGSIALVTHSNSSSIPHDRPSSSLIGSASGGFSHTAVLLARPRSYGFEAPKLTRVPGKFKCGYCKATWASHNVLVTEQTRKAYQGETCASCGTTVKPFWTGEFQGTDFNKIRHFRTNDHRYKFQRYKLRQQ